MLAILSFLLVVMVLLVFKMLFDLPFGFLRSLHLPQWLLLTGLVLLFAWLIGDDR